MKENKFRAWDKINKKMYYIQGFIQRLNTIRIWYEEDDMIYNQSFHKDNIIIIQYIGLKDKNDEWYHYDILKIICSKERYLIDWNFNRWVLINLKSNRKEEFRQIDLSFFKKIGNKFENPELLKE